MSRTIFLSLLAALAMLAVSCKPDYPNCKKDKHCHEGEFCVNNICQQCRDNADCAKGEECAQGACRAIPGYCESVSDCAPGQVCRNNICGPCYSDDECGPDQVCADGQCLVPECRSDEDCPAGLYCQNYRCKAQEQVSTMGSGDCSPDSVYFDFDSSEVNSSNRRALESTFECLQKRGGRVTLEGHCDAVGTTEYNMALGDRRARMVKHLLHRMGLENTNKRTVSKAKEDATPPGPNDRDRRVDFK